MNQLDLLLEDHFDDLENDIIRNEGPLLNKALKNKKGSRYKRELRQIKNLNREFDDKYKEIVLPKIKEGYKCLTIQQILENDEDSATYRQWAKKVRNKGTAKMPLYFKFQYKNTNYKGTTCIYSETELEGVIEVKFFMKKGNNKGKLVTPVNTLTNKYFTSSKAEEILKEKK